MSRWGEEIYESDASADSLGTITHGLERELAYWLAPEWVEQIGKTSGWLGHVLAIIELMLLFEQHYFDSSVFLADHEKAVRRWRDVVLNVWDGNWNEEKPNSLVAYGYLGRLDYRQRHHVAISAMFDRLESIANYWTDMANHPGELPALSKEHSLPYFSIARWVNWQGKEHVGVESFVGDLTESLLKDIIYRLSPEGRHLADIWYGAPIYVFVDLLGFLCEIYDISPGVAEERVRAWCDTTLEFAADEPPTLLSNITNAFDRLERAAQKHPKKFP